MLMWVSPYWMAQFFGEDGDAAFALDIVRVHDPFADLLVSRKVPDWRRSWSTRVVLPWSTWAMIAMLRMARDMGWIPEVLVNQNFSTSLRNAASKAQRGAC